MPLGVRHHDSYQRLHPAQRFLARLLVARSPALGGHLHTELIHRPQKGLSGHPKPANRERDQDIENDGGITSVIVSNVLTEEKKQQVLTLGRLGWSLRRIEKQTGVRRETAGAYLKAGGIALRPPGAWGKRAPPKPANEVTTDSSVGAEPEGAEQTAKPANTVTTAPTPSNSACEPYRAFIEQALLANRNAVSIWQELVDRHSFSGAYETVKRFVRKQRGAQTPEARAVILTAPGEEAQVDYGTGPQVWDPKTGKYRRTRLFVLTLGCSRKCIRLLSFQSSSRIWAELHETAFRRLGGTTKYVVLDNLTEGVLKPDIYDPKLNPLYRDVLAHYNAVAMPCRVRDPDRKGKVERGVGHAKQTPLKGKRFESLTEAQTYLDHWEERLADFSAYPAAASSLFFFACSIR